MTSPASTIFCRLIRMPSLACTHVRPPYAVYFQGGLTWYHAKLGILMSLQKLVDAGLAKLPE